MKICMLSTFYPFRGGIAQFNASLYRALETDHEVKAYTFTRQYPNFLFPGKTQYITKHDKADKINSIAILDTINPFSYFKTAKIINKFSPDLLIMKYWIPFLGASLGTAAKKINNKTKIITVLDNVIPHEQRFFDNLITKYFLKQNDGFVVMSDVVKDDLLELTYNKAKFIKIEHPIYDHFGKKINSNIAKEKLKIPLDKKTLLFFGFIRDYKGLDVLIRTLNELDETYQLIIAGESYGSFEKYQKLINNSKLKNNIHVFNDYISDEQVPDFFSAADICVLPYKSATQSGITSIAYHFELPVIATDVGGLKEVINDDMTGIVIKKPDTHLLAEAIKRYFECSLEKKFIKNIQLLKNERSWQNFAQQIVEFSYTIIKS